MSTCEHGIDIGVTGGGNPMFYYDLYETEAAIAGLGPNSEALKGGK